MDENTGTDKNLVDENNMIAESSNNMSIVSHEEEKTSIINEHSLDNSDVPEFTGNRKERRAQAAQYKKKKHLKKDHNHNQNDSVHIVDLPEDYQHNTNSDLSDSEQNKNQSGATRINSSVNDEIDEYYKDDEYFINHEEEEFLLGDDELVVDDDVMGAVAQLDNVVTWEIDNLINDEAKLKNRYALRLDPPVFRIKSSDGTMAEFVVTKELSRGLKDSFAQIEKAYFGIDTRSSKDKSNMTFNERILEVIHDGQNHPVRSGFIILFIVLILCSPFIL